MYAFSEAYRSRWLEIQLALGSLFLIAIQKLGIFLIHKLKRNIKPEVFCTMGEIMIMATPLRLDKKSASYALK